MNEGHVVDAAEIGGEEDTGADMLYEIKCKSPLKQHFSCGRGSATHGGAPAYMGRKIGFGSTEEEVARAARQGRGRVRPHQVRDLALQRALVYGASHAARLTCCGHV